MCMLESYFKSLALLALFSLLVGIFPAATLAGTEAITIMVDGQKLNLKDSPVTRNGTVLAPVRPLAEALRARATWNEQAREVIITGPQTTVKMVVGEKQAIKNGETLPLAVPVLMQNGCVLAPVRFLAEALGAMVCWNGLTQTVAISSPPSAVPERVYAEPFSARVAFTANNNLWLLDGSQAGAKPVQVTEEGSAEILGWSPDGQWLAYLQWETSEFWAGKPYLWVVRADGSGAFQVDPRPVLERAAWSPEANILAYSTQGPEGGYAPDMNLKLAAIKDGKAEVTALIPDKSELVQDFTWAPDGRSLAISLARTEDHPVRIDRITLRGERTNFLTLGGAGIALGEVYPSFATGLSWSPNGRFLAYYLHPNSASLAADGVQLQVLDLEKPGQPLDLGTCLHYRHWLAWSPDGRRLAFIQGSGREATYNKRLCVVTLPEGTIAFYDQPGKADTGPLWLPAPADGVLFCRGLERTSWGDDKPSGVLLSDHRIWLAASGQARPLTSGPPDTADYYPSISPDRQDLYFVRLNGADRGSLYRQPLAGGPEVELVRGLSGSPGYYGNYHPAWVSIYYLDSTTRATGKLVLSTLEGRHFELETGQTRLVLVPETEGSPIAEDLEKYVGQTVTVEGVITNDPNTYMRGPLMKVKSIWPSDSS